MMSAGRSFAVVGAALALSACDVPRPHARAPLRAVSSLDCPDTQGELTRKSAAADGKSCIYATESGDQVTLRLVSLPGGDAQAALAPIETQLKAEVPSVVTTAASGSAGGASAGADGAPDKDRVDINLPGLHIHAHGDGHADIDTAGVHVHAHDNGDHGGDHADVRIDGLGSKGVTVDANGAGAQIHVDEGGSGVRARYILAGETPGPHGYKVAGYDARGPAGGPIVVAEILAKSDDHDDLDHDARELLRRNVGG